MNMHVLLGIDPGLERTGWGLIHVAYTPTFIAADVMMTSRTASMPERLADLYTQLTALIQKHRPTHAAVEKLYMSRNVKTAMMVAEARGVILLTLGRAHIPLISLTPNEVKHGVTGYGRTEKRGVQQMVARLLHLPRPIASDDAADALAVAIAACPHIHRLKEISHT